MFYLEKFRESLKSEIVVKKTLKNELIKTRAKEAKKIILKLDKEIFILKTLKDLNFFGTNIRKLYYPQSINEYNFLCAIKKSLF